MARMAPGIFAFTQPKTSSMSRMNKGAASLSTPWIRMREHCPPCKRFRRYLKTGQARANARRFAIDPNTGLLTAMGHAIAEKTLAPLRLILPVAFYYQRAMHPGALPSTVSTKTLAASRARLRMSWATSQCG